MGSKGLVLLRVDGVARQWILGSSKSLVPILSASQNPRCKLVSVMVSVCCCCCFCYFAE